MKLYLKLLTFLFTLVGTEVFSQSSSLSLAGASHNINLPIEVTADSLSINQSSNTAIFEGSAYVGQGLLRLSADKITVNYSKTDGEIASIEAVGNVIFTNGVDIAEAENAFYTINSGLLYMNGNVLLVQGRSTISGDKLNLNILTNVANLTGNVKTVLAPK